MVNMEYFELLTGEDVSEILKVSKSFVYRLIQNGTVKSVVLGKSIRVRRSDLADFINRNSY
jgi:excisionase family DNA binding protein